MNYGYSGGNTHLENHNVSEEGFWPSFTDIMMVIVMVFLLVTVAVILKNWTLISELKSSIQAQQLASSLADNRQVENQTLEEKLSSLETKFLSLNEKYELEKTSLLDTQEQLSESELNLNTKTAQLTEIEKQLQLLSEKFEQELQNLNVATQKLSETEKQLAEKDSSLSVLNQQLIEANELSEANQLSLSKAQAELSENEQLLSDKDRALVSLKNRLSKTEEEQKKLVALTEQQKSDIEKSEKLKQSLQQELEKNKTSLSSLKATQEKNINEIETLKAEIDEKVQIAGALQAERGELDKKLSILQKDYDSTKEDLVKESQAAEKFEAEVDTLKQSLSSAQKETQDQQVLTTQLAALETQLQSTQKLIEDKDQKIADLEKNQIAGNEQLRSLQGEYDTLDSKYQKLLRPARSSKGKFVVTVSYRKRGKTKTIRLKSKPDGSYKNVSSSELDKQLTKLKKKHGDDLYIKVVIPEKSGLSYNEAWKFTNKLQKSFDYYYQ